MFLYRLRDNEEDIVNYEDFIITEENVKNLIEDSLQVYANAINYESIGEFLEDNEDLKIDEKVVEFLNAHLEDDINLFGNAIEFALEILQENNIKVINFEEKNIWY